MLLPCLSIFSLMFSLYSVYIQCEDFAKLTVFGFVPVDVSVSLIFLSLWTLGFDLGGRC